MFVAECLDILGVQVYFYIADFYRVSSLIDLIYFRINTFFVLDTTKPRYLFKYVILTVLSMFLHVLFQFEETLLNSLLEYFRDRLD